MEKVEFRFVFPKKNVEQKAMCNPMHVEAATALAMSDNKTDLCQVYHGDTLHHITVYDEKEGFKHYYRDDTERVDVYVVCGNEAMMQLADAEDFDEAVLEVERDEAMRGAHLVHKICYSQKEADAFISGLQTAMSITDNEGNYRCFTDSERYSEIERWRDEGARD